MSVLVAVADICVVFAVAAVAGNHDNKAFGAITQQEFFAIKDESVHELIAQ